MTDIREKEKNVKMHLKDLRQDTKNGTAVTEELVYRSQMKLKP